VKTSISKLLPLISLTFLTAYSQREDNLITKRLKIPFDNIVATLSYQGKGTITIIGIDNRPNILYSTDENNFVGLVRAPAGVPWRLRKKSGNPFIQDITTSIKLSLKKAGFKVSNYYGVDLQKIDSLTSLSSNQSTNRTRVVKVHEFKSYHYDMGLLVHNRTLTYEIELQILNGTGNPIHSEKFSAQDIELDKRVMERANLMS
jgi:hypothetical protein